MNVVKKIATAETAENSLRTQKTDYTDLQARAGTGILLRLRAI